MSGILRVSLPPGQWRPGPGLTAGDVRPAERETLNVQLIPWTLRPVLDEVDRPTGWVAAQCWWHRPDEPAPDLLRLLVRVEALPDGTLPEPDGGDG